MSVLNPDRWPAMPSRLPQLEELSIGIVYRLTHQLKQLTMADLDAIHRNLPRLRRLRLDNAFGADIWAEEVVPCDNLRELELIVRGRYIGLGYFVRKYARPEQLKFQLYNQSEQTLHEELRSEELSNKVGFWQSLGKLTLLSTSPHQPLFLTLKFARCAPCSFGDSGHVQHG
ncbi:hypothetical protein EC973_009109 [Apophysomyces ossiformis]|uniref:Uncharacterized protein n=1 Tax=Apophysomyces ossiformis TaxID=679940 RepID=A0A8H7ET69_9FUNG|nr:hypothetical protein EC973_009109 [Apophysomyces ossiformis]